jgi:hypothetical protein
MSKLSGYALSVVISIIFLIALCAYLDSKFNTDFPLCVAAIGSGLFTFALCIVISEESGRTWISEAGDIRATIAISLVVEYMVAAGFTIFFDTGKELPPIAQSFITNFTSIVGVVIAFYFGSSAYVQGQDHKKGLTRKSEAEPAADRGKADPVAKTA